MIVYCFFAFAMLLVIREVSASSLSDCPGVYDLASDFPVELLSSSALYLADDASDIGILALDFDIPSIYYNVEFDFAELCGSSTPLQPAVLVETVGCVDHYYTAFDYIQYCTISHPSDAINPASSYPSVAGFVRVNASVDIAVGEWTIERQVSIPFAWEDVTQQCEAAGYVTTQCEVLDDNTGADAGSDSNVVDDYEEESNDESPTTLTLDECAALNAEETLVYGAMGFVAGIVTTALCFVVFVQRSKKKDSAGTEKRPVQDKNNKYYNAPSSDLMTPGGLQRSIDDPVFTPSIQGRTMADTPGMGGRELILGEDGELRLKDITFTPQPEQQRRVLKPASKRFSKLRLHREASEDGAGDLDDRILVEQDIPSSTQMSFRGLAENTPMQSGRLLETPDTPGDGKFNFSPTVKSLQELDKIVEERSRKNTPLATPKTEPTQRRASRKSITELPPEAELEDM